MTPWAEVIGDPITHTLSPSIHRHWLATSGIAARYEATRVTAAELSAFVARRRQDPAWHGCNITAPHKERIVVMLDQVDAAAAAVGAVNCVHRDGPELIGTNTDVEGIAEALHGVPIRGAKAAVIGGGGAARAAVHYLRQQGAAEIALVVRRPEAAQGWDGVSAVVSFTDAHQAFASAALIVNATPLGLAGGQAMPAQLVAAARSAGATAAFDMVYRPLRTPFLDAMHDGGARSIDGLTMLIGQARKAFTLFFGADPPSHGDGELRTLLGA